MAGKRQKPRAALVDDRPRRVGQGDLVLVERARRDVPPAPRGVRPNARKAWRAFWESDLAQLVTDADLPGLRHWVECLSERERLGELLRKAPLVTGSTGQLRSNPLLDTIKHLDSEIARAEERFGMTPLARMRLGIALGEAASLLDDLRASLGRSEPQLVDVSSVVLDFDP